MGIFDFESMFAEAYDNIEEKGVSVYYADMYDVNENIVCIQTPDGTIYDKNNYILEDQLRYQHMIDMSALKVVRSEVYESVDYEVNPWGIIEAASIREAKIYKKLKKTVASLVNRGIIPVENADELYNLVVDEYEDMGDNPSDATIQDVVEIYGASF